MDWLHSFVDFIAAICTIYTTIFGVSLIRIRKKINSSQPSGVSNPLKSIHWTEWMTIFAKGFNGIAHALMSSRIVQSLGLEDSIKEASFRKLGTVRSTSQSSTPQDDEQRRASSKKHLLELEDSTREQVAGWIAVSYGCGLLLVGFFLAVALTLVLFIHNAFTMVLTVMCFLLFLTVSVPYIYQVGKQIDNRQHEDQSALKQQEVTQ